RRVSLNLNTSPVTVPSRAPSVVIQLARRPEVRNSPVTLPPSCFNVSQRSAGPLMAPILPYPEPLTCSVTQGRSIQAVCAQAIVLAIASPRSTLARFLTSRFDPRTSSRRRSGSRERVDATERHPTVPATPEDLPAHVVAAHRELAVRRAPQVLEGEHI